MKKSVVIIGGGIGGLATAALLGRDGYDVTIIEKNKKVGGRASSWESKGFTFDLGPSWYMMPEVFTNYFKSFNKTPQDYYDLIELDPRYKVFINKKEFLLSSSQKQNVALFKSLEPNGGKKLQEYLKESKRRYEIAMEKLVYFDYSSPFQVFAKDIFKNIFSLGLFSTYHQEITKRFKNKDLQKILEFVTVFLGGSPFITPGFYTLISHTDFGLKIWHPKGGIYKVIQGLEKLCKENNVTIKTNETVTKINIKNKTATTILTNKNTYTPDVVISNADYAFTEMHLLEKKYQTYSEEFWEKQTLAPSALMIYVGINKKLKNVAHHNLYFDDNWDDHFEEVYKKHSWPQNPSYYVNIPSVTDSLVAPKNSESLIFLVPVSSHLSDTGNDRDLLADRIITHFESVIKQKISPYIQTKQLYSHRDFIKDYNAYKGSAFGIAHTLIQTGPFRPNNKSKKVKNLFYVGQYTNPGIGLPPCVISAQIVHNLITHEK